MPTTAAEYLAEASRVAERTRAAAITTLEEHRPWNPDGISLACVHDFLRRLDTIALGEFVGEALAEKLDPLDLCALAEASRQNDHAEAGRIVTRAIRQHADGVLCRYAR